MKKKLFLILLILLLLIMPVMLLCGCGKVPKSEDFSTENIDRFLFIKQYGDNNGETIQILVDKETRVMYMFYHDNGGNSGTAGLTVMLNADGTPMLWEGEL